MILNLLQELISYFQPGGPGNGVHAVPGEGLDVPIWLLGSSDFSARLAAELGLPFAFASHFAPDSLHVALNLYRMHFKPSATWERPHVAVGVNVVAGETDEEAQRMFTSLQQAFLNLVRGTPGLFPPAVDSMEGRWNFLEEQHVHRMTRCSAVGTVATVRRQLISIVDSTDADELVLVGPIENHAARLRSFEVISGLQRRAS